MILSNLHNRFMEIRTLKYFLAVTREQSILGAAKSQPTLSRQLKELENNLGKQLFIRGNKKITLTEEGMLFKKRAEEIIDLVNKTEIEMSSSNENINGCVYLGMAETDTINLIAKCIKKIQIKFPNIQFNISSDDGDDVITNLDKGLIDFGIVICPFDKGEYDYITLPSKDIWGVLMRKDSSLAKLDYITANDLKDKPLIISRQVQTTTEFSNWFKTDINKLNIIAQYNLVYNASILVKNNIGYALTLDKLIDTSNPSIFTFKPLCPKLDSEINIIWKKYQMFSKPAEKFLSQIKKEIDYTNA